MNGVVSVLLKHGNDDHHPNPDKHGKDLQKRLEQWRVLQEIGDDRHSGDVDEPSRREGKDPSNGGRADPLCQESAQRPTEGSDRRDQLQRHCLFLGVARLDEDGKVSDLVRDLVQEDCDGRDDTDIAPGQIRGSDGKTIGEIVGEIGGQIEVPGHLDVATTAARACLCHVCHLTFIWR